MMGLGMVVIRVYWYQVAMCLGDWCEGCCVCGKGNNVLQNCAIRLANRLVSVSEYLL